MTDAPFAGWSDEIAVELLHARLALEDAVESEKVADEALRVAKTQQEVLRGKVVAIKPPFARALATRLAFTQHDVHRAEGQLVQAQGRVGLAREHISDLEQALSQIEALTPPLPPPPPPDAPEVAA